MHACLCKLRARLPLAEVEVAHDLQPRGREETVDALDVALVREELQAQGDTHDPMSNYVYIHRRTSI